MDAHEVARVLDALEAADVRVSVTGGWGIDALIGRQRRPHDDIDLGLADRDVETALDALAALGYVVTDDLRPARLLLRDERGQVDLHPIVWDPSGAGVQAGLDGQTFEYPPGSLDAIGTIGGREVRCGTPDLQVAFHRGYLPTDRDRDDMAALADMFGLTLPSPYSTADSA